MKQPTLKKQVILRKKEDRRIAAGHPWVYSNEIRSINGDPSIGDVVEILSSNGTTLGIGFFNPHSLIAVRKLSRDPAETIDAEFFRRRLQQALATRAIMFNGADAFRVAHGEGDYLPGLVVDKLGTCIAVQTYSYGMDIRLNTICDVIEELLQPKAIVERNESTTRTLEHLDLRKGVLRGAPEIQEIQEHGVRYKVDVLGGQKTGFFLDQRENRASVRLFSRGARVLDCFCNSGGFALNGAAAGAETVVGLDSSSEAISASSANAALNGFSSARFEVADVFMKLAEYADQGIRFDTIVLDPPSFTKSRKNVYSAKLGYRELHRLAFAVLADGGTLLSSSCSHHIDPDVFLKIIDDSARAAGRAIQLLDWRGASPDHPTLPSVPETRYLKFGLFRVN